MTAAQAPKSQRTSAKHTVLPNGLRGIDRAAWEKTAGSGQKRRYESVIGDENQGNNSASKSIHYRSSLSAAPGLNDSLPELTLHLGERQAGRSLSGDNQHVLARNNLLAMLAETFSDEPLYTVPNHCVADLGAHSDSQPSLSLVIRSNYDHEIGGVYLLPPARQVQEFGSLSQTGALRKT